MDEDRSAEGRYRVMERLATGGMAEVFYAEAFGVADFRKPVAIKRVLPHLAANEKFIRMFLDEARLSARLSHRNIVQVFDVGRMNDAYFIVMEYVDGVTLRGLMEHVAHKGRTVPVPVAVHIAIECATALAYAHELADRTGTPLGIVHRDVSPPNVLIARTGGVKLVDFGLARARTQLEKTDPGVVKGKFAYLAPETARGEVIGPAADIFSLGAVLWEMLAGRTLFAADDDWKTLERVKKCDVPSLHALEPGVPEALDAIVRRALAKNPGDRYARAADFARALTGFLFANGAPVGADELAELARDALGGTGPLVTGRQSSVSADESEKLLALSPVDPAGSPVTAPGMTTLSDAPERADTHRGGARWMLWVGLAMLLGAGAAVASVAASHWRASTTHDGTAVNAVRADGAAVTRDTAAADTAADPVDARAEDAARALGTDASIAAAPVDASVPSEEPTQAANEPVAPMPVATAAPRSGRAIQPDAATRTRMYRDITHRIDACERRLGWQGRHARVLAQYDGPSGRVVSARVTGAYFPRRPIGACIVDAVRAVPAPPFRHARWSTDYSFWLR